MKKIRNIFLVMLLGFTFGCGFKAHTRWRPFPGYIELPPTTEVEIFSMKPDRSFIEIGSLVAEGWGKNRALENAVSRAKVVGADAFVILEEKPTEAPGLIEIRGTLIRWKTE